MGEPAGVAEPALTGMVLMRFLPAAPVTSRLEQFRAAIGALIGIAVTGFVATLWLGPGTGALLLIAPIGASAVLLFGVPASPLAQPWSIIGGNLVAAVIGVAAARWIPSPVLATSLAVGAALGLMAMLRCVHPPSGAVALTAVLGGPHVAALGFGFVLVPVLLNSVLLLAVAIVYNNATGRSYPHLPHAPAHPHPAPSAFTAADLDAALADYGEPLDIDRDDLETLMRDVLGRIERRSARR